MKKREIRSYSGIGVPHLREVQEGQAESRTIEGYAIVFGCESVLLVDWCDAYREIIEPGAVTEQDLAGWDIKMTMWHNRERLLARSNNGEGTLRLSVDERGVKYSFEAPHTADGDTVLELVKRGDLAGSSFTYSTDSDGVRYEKREEEFGSNIMREIERVMLLRSVDTNWMDHIDAMDQLRQGIGLRAYGQHDPVVEYRNDSYDMFEAMTATIRQQTAKLVLTEGAKGMRGAIEAAEKICKETPGSVIAGQFDNPANPRAHYETTGPEIFADTDGTVDFFVAGVGTGGTLSGAGRFLKEKTKAKIVAVEPFSSPVLSKGVAGAHNLQGIGAGFVPKNLDVSLIDEIVAVKEIDAYACARELAQKEGVLVGISSGAALYAASLIAANERNAGKNIVVICPDTGDRYLSTELFES